MLQAGATNMVAKRPEILPLYFFDPVPRVEYNQIVGKLEAAFRARMFQMTFFWSFVPLTRWLHA